MGVGVVHISLTEKGNGRVELRYWTDNPITNLSRTIRLDEIGDLVQQAEVEYYGAVKKDEPVSRVAELPQRDFGPEWLQEQKPEAIGHRLFDWLDLPDRWLLRTFEQVGQREIALAIESNRRLGHLPWELLHDGTAYLVHGKNRAVLPIRWCRTRVSHRGPNNRPLNVLFMATSPNGTRELAYEEEEAKILRATEQYPLVLTVEETGNLDELAGIMKGYSEDHFDVLHLTGHADHRDEGARFLTELPTGEPHWVSADEIVRKLPHRPPLVFLSGCRTGQSPGAGAVPSLADELLDSAFPAVVGWGRPVFDDNAIVAAAALYDYLNAGRTVVEALLHAHGVMKEMKVEHWHLLRLFLAGEIPPPLVTPPMTQGRKKAVPVIHNRRFMGKKQNPTNWVVDYRDFVGRRRPLQRCLRALRGSDYPAGAIIFGLNGVGKSSLAFRLCDRLVESHEAVVHNGVLDEPGLIRSLRELSGGNEKSRMALQVSGESLDLRLRAFFEHRNEAGLKTMLIVLDDFEENINVREGGQAVIEPAAQAVMEALIWSIEKSAGAKCLITCRYEPMASQGSKFYREQLIAMTATDAKKKHRALQAYSKLSKELMAGFTQGSDGNPRLVEQMDKAIDECPFDSPSLRERMSAVEERFLAEALKQELVSKLPAQTRQLLFKMLVYRVTVPFEAITALVPELPEAEIRGSLQSAITLGLLEFDPHQEQGVYRVPRILEPCLVDSSTETLLQFADTALDSLIKICTYDGRKVTEAEALEMARLGRSVKRVGVVVEIIDQVGQHWEDQHRFVEARQLYEEAIGDIGSAYPLLAGLSRCELMLGNGDRAHDLISEAVRACPIWDDVNRHKLLYQLARSHNVRGEGDRALQILREERMPFLEALGMDRDIAISYLEIADILAKRGHAREAQSVLHERCLPIAQQLDDVELEGRTRLRIAEGQEMLGATNEAIKNYVKCMALFARSGNEQLEGLAKSNLAGMLASDNEYDEVLRILRDEELPIHEALGDVRNRAVTLCQIADVLRKKGNHDEALLILRQDCLPVFERLEDLRSQAGARLSIVDCLYARGEREEPTRILSDEVLPICRKIGDSQLIAQPLARLGIMELDAGRRLAALRLLNEALHYAQQAGDRDTITHLERVLGVKET